MFIFKGEYESLFQYRAQFMYKGYIFSDLCLANSDHQLKDKCYKNMEAVLEDIMQVDELVDHISRSLLDNMKPTNSWFPA